MRTCTSCGTNLAPDANFCPNCGARFGVNENLSPVSKKWTIILLSGIGVLIVIAVIVDLGFRASRANRSSTNTNSSANLKVVNSNSPITPEPTPTFEQLKSSADRLLAIDKNAYDSVDPADFDRVMQPLAAVPKDSKDHKVAAALHKKLIDKSSVILAERLVLGPKPKNSEWDGSVQAVKTYLKAALNDYDSSEFVEWSPVIKAYEGKEPYWVVRLKLRAKNAFGAYILRDTYYFIRNDQVVMSKGLS